MDQINGTQYLLLKPSTQTDILPQHKLFLCGYAVLNQTVWYIINCAQDLTLASVNNKWQNFCFIWLQ
jgi:hypothetical protein